MKGQSSLEFLAMVSLSMIILAALYSVMVSKQQDTIGFQQEKTADFVAEKVSFEAEMALVQGEGYSRVFSLPSNIGGDNYTIALGQGETTLTSEGTSVYRLSRYQGEKIYLSVNDSNQLFRVKHNESGVFIVDQ